MTLPEDLNRLESSALKGTTASAIAIPSGVTFIAEDALGDTVTLVITDKAKTYVTDWCDAHHLQWTVQDNIYSIP